MKHYELRTRIIKASPDVEVPVTFDIPDDEHVAAVETHHVHGTLLFFHVHTIRFVQPAAAKRRPVRTNSHA